MLWVSPQNNKVLLRRLVLTYITLLCAEQHTPRHLLCHQPTNQKTKKMYVVQTNNNAQVSERDWLRGFHRMLTDRAIVVNSKRTLSLATWLNLFCEKANQELAVVLQKM